MKTFELKSPSKKSQKKMKRKLFFLEIKHNFQKILSLKNLQIIIPTFALGIFVFGFIYLQNLSITNPKSSHYLAQVRNQTEQVRGEYYTKYAMIRSLRK